MKRLFFIAFLLLAIGAQSATVVFNFQNFISGSIANRPFVITPLSTPTVSSTNIISSDVITTNTANGTISVAAMVAGTYRCEIKTPVTTKPVMTTPFQITVPDTNGTVDASTIITASTNVSSGSVAYSAAAADARFLRRDEQFGFDTNQMTVTGTNVVFKRGAVVTNLVVKNIGLGPALSLADGASMRLTNGVATFGSNSTVNIGDGSGLGSAEIRFDSTATVSDYTGSERWNFKTAVGGGSDANTVARLSNITNSVSALSNTLAGLTLKAAGPLVPKSDKSFYAFGDSQTAGINSSGASYTSGGSILPQYQWVSLVASNNGKTLSVSNWGIGGSRLSFYGSTIPTTSIFNSMGRLTNTWTGLAALMGGWNDLGNYPADDRFFEVMTHAYEACLARLLIDDWFGLTYLGWSRTGAPTGTADTPSWATDGVNLQWTESDRDSIPFWFPGAAARYANAMTGANTNQMLFAFKKAAALFFDTTPNSGLITVLLNRTNVIGTFNLNTLSVDSLAHFPFVVWIDNLPTNALITLTNNLAASKTNLFLAAGYVNPISRPPDRVVMMVSTTANTNAIGSPFGGSQRALTNLFSLAKASESAAASFADVGLPVYFANTFNNYVNATDFEPSDQSHFTPTGNEHVANAVQAAYRASGYFSSNVFRLMRAEWAR